MILKLCTMIMVTVLVKLTILIPIKVIMYKMINTLQMTI